MEITIRQAIENYLGTVEQARSARTARTYRNALNVFSAVLRERACDPIETPVSRLTETAVADFIAELKAYAPATERLYLTAVTNFYEFILAEGLNEPNLAKVRNLIRQRARRPGIRLPQFPKTDIEKILEYAIKLAITQSNDEAEHLRNLRDQAFLLTLADTGLRVHEACALRRGDIDWNEGRALVTGKGNRQAVVRFSKRALASLRNYLNIRARQDGNTGRPLPSLALFARHDKGAGKKTKPITTATGRNIVKQRVREALGAAAEGNITPHSFRHYFVTTVLRGSGGNLKLAQELARHKNIAITTRYAHLSDSELDEGYAEIFERGS